MSKAKIGVYIFLALVALALLGGMAHLVMNGAISH